MATALTDHNVRPSARSSATTSARLSNDAEFLAAAGGQNTSTTATRALPSMALWSSLAADAAAAEDSLLLPHHHDSREDERHHHTTTTTTSTTTLPPAAEKGRHRASSTESVDVVATFLDGRTAAGFVAQLKAAIPLNFQTRRAVTIGIATTCVACIVILACALHLVHRDAGGGATVELTSSGGDAGVSYEAPHAAYRTGAAAKRNSMQCTQWRGYNLHSAPGTTRIVHPGGIGTRSYLLIFLT